MGKMTFVVDYPDGQEPAVSAGTDILGGMLISVSCHDAVEMAGFTADFLGRLQSGEYWFDALLAVAEDNDWKFQEISRGYAKIAVPDEQVCAVERLVRMCAPAVFRIDVTARKQPGIVESLHP